MSITEPGVIGPVTGEEVTPERLSDAGAHMGKTGSIDFVTNDGKRAILVAQKPLSLLPQNNTEEPPVVDPIFDAEPDPGLRDIAPVDGKKDYNVCEVIIRIADNGDSLECQTSFATNLVTDFGQVLGHTVGFVADQLSVMSGVLDIDSSDKGTKFIRFCNAFNTPLVTPVDAPGFTPGVTQEHGGIIRHGAEMLCTYSVASVPKVTAAAHKVYGDAYLAMCLKDPGVDYVFAWPIAEVVAMGVEGAVNTVFRKEIAAAGDEEEQARVRDERIAEYKTRSSTPYVAVSRRLVDDMIDSAGTHLRVADALSVLRSKHEVRPAKKHGLGPQ